MALPRPRKERRKYLGALLPPMLCPLHCHPAARAQSSFSLREAAFWEVQKEQHPPPRARCPGALGLWLGCRSRSGRALATGTAWAGLCLIHHHRRLATRERRERTEVCVRNANHTLHRALHDGRPVFPGADGRLPIRPRCGRNGFTPLNLSPGFKWRTYVDGHGLTKISLAASHGTR